MRPHVSEPKLGLASELLLERYAIPDTSNAKSLLAGYEHGIRNELRVVALCTMPHHLGVAFDRAILPRALEFIFAIGLRMAYDAAIEAKIDNSLIDLFVAASLKKDSSFYVEKAGLSRARQREMEADAVDLVYERLEEFLTPLDIEPYISESECNWDEYMGSLQTYGEASLDNDSDEPKASTTLSKLTSLPYFRSPSMQLTAAAKL